MRKTGQYTLSPTCHDRIRDGISVWGGDGMARTDPRNRSQFRTVAGLPGVSLLTADFTTHEFAMHTHDTFVFAMTEAGGATFRTRNRSDRTRAGALLAFNPEEPHDSRQDERGRWRYRGVYVGTALVREVGEALGLDRLPAIGPNQIDDRRLVAAFVRAHRACEADGALAGGDALRQALARLLADHCGGQAPAGSGAPRADTRIDRVIDYMRAHYADDLTLDDLARQIDLSPFQLCRSFRRALGMPPYGYVTQIRLRAAIRLMREGASMADAAAGAGFYDQAAMIRHFKRTHGFTPRQMLAA